MEIPDRRYLATDLFLALVAGLCFVGRRKSSEQSVLRALRNTERTLGAKFWRSDSTVYIQRTVQRYNIFRDIYSQL